MLALQARGVDAGRLLARASGTTAPVCGQQSESCRARERTVEFATLAPAKTAAAAESDKPAAEVEAGAGKAAPAETAPAPIPLERVEFKKGSAGHRARRRSPTSTSWPAS